MRAWLYSAPCGNLEQAIKLTEDAPDPSQQPLARDAVLVKVHRMSLNPADHKIAELGQITRLIASMPATPGMDFAGTVEKAGEGVKDYGPGDRVFGRAVRGGALADYVVVPPSALAHLPSGVSMDQGSCVGTAGLTAYQCVVPNAGGAGAGGAGDRVFINGGSGGTGTFGIQMAKALGCHVTASCSARNAGLCRELGADRVIDYTAENVSEALKREGEGEGEGDKALFKLVVDNVGVDPPDLHKAADHYLRPDGKFVQVGAPVSLSATATLLSRALRPAFLGGGRSKWEFLVCKNKPEDLAQIAEWMEQGKVKAVIDEVFDFESAPKAIKKLKSGRCRGKVVVKVSEGAE
ncbi:hypothetical protein F4778DRAFT_279552 [Xylariomycetidae sp. FL2044]|nr:hypothetical protein F4778DRAFT_279552 [Xylariomycetidae sp. FL2044]